MITSSSTLATTPTVTHRDRRTTVLRVLATLFALALLYMPGLGIVDLVAAFLDLPDRHPLAIMRVGYGLLVGFVLPVAFFVIARQPQRAVAPLLQILAAASAFLLAAVASGVAAGVVGAGILVLFAATLLTLGRARRASITRSRHRIAKPMLVLAVCGLAPWVSYAVAMAAQERRNALPYEDFTLGVQGWSALTTFALALALSSFLVSWRPVGWRSTAWTTGAAAVVFGIFAAIGDALPGSPGRLWGALAVAWGLALIAAAHFSTGPRVSTDVSAD